MTRAVLALILCACTGGSASHSPTPSPTVPAPVPAQRAQPPAQPVAHDPVSSIVPGDSIGPVTKASTRASLAERLGEDALKDSMIDIGEGQQQAGTLIHGGTDHSLEVVWSDSARTSVDFVRVTGRAWTLPGGLQLGASYRQVQEALGPFSLYGFGWDYGGTIVLTDTKLAAYSETLTLRLALPHDTPQSGDITSIFGDRVIASNAPVLLELQPTLYEAIARLR